MDEGISYEQLLEISKNNDCDFTIEFEEEKIYLNTFSIAEKFNFSVVRESLSMCVDMFLEHINKEE